jgi:hypothetical protein
VKVQVRRQDLNMDADIFVADSITRKERKNDGSKELGPTEKLRSESCRSFPNFGGGMAAQ